MDRDKKNILCVNGGSSSIKFSVYETDGEELTIVLKGKIDKIGLDGASLTWRDYLNEGEGKVALKEVGVEGSGMKEAADFLLEWLGRRMAESRGGQTTNGG